MNASSTTVKNEILWVTDEPSEAEKCWIGISLELRGGNINPLLIYLRAEATPPVAGLDLPRLADAVERRKWGKDQRSRGKGRQTATSDPYELASRGKFDKLIALLLDVCVPGEIPDLHSLVDFFRLKSPTKGRKNSDGRPSIPKLMRACRAEQTTLAVDAYIEKGLRASIAIHRVSQATGSSIDTVKADRVRHKKSIRLRHAEAARKSGRSKKT